MQGFARPGDKILTATNDYAALATGAARSANGAVTLLVVNKSLVTNLNAQLTLNGFTPSAVATIRSYGIPQDEAARTNAGLALQDIAVTNIFNAGTNFSCNFPRLSMTLLTLAPAAPGLAVVSSDIRSGFIFQLRGQTDVPYTIQNSTNLIDWFPVATNVPAGNPVNITNAPPFDSDVKFWRAVWQP
jgi:hypothetical protein